MIILPTHNTASATPEFISNGFLQRGIIGETTRIDRKGSRYRVAFSIGPFYADEGNLFVSRLLAAERQGLRVPYPLQSGQGSPGFALVNGAGQSGETISLKSVTPGYVCREGYWLSIEDENERHYLHNVQTGGRADASGNLVIGVTPELRHPFLNNAKVHIAKPMVQGWTVGAVSWDLNGDKVIALQFTIEEAA